MSGILCLRPEVGQRLLTAKAPQYPRSLVTLFVQFSRPKSFTADFIRKPVHWGAQLVRPSPDFIEALLAALLCPVPGRQHGSNSLHRYQWAPTTCPGIARLFPGESELRITFAKEAETSNFTRISGAREWCSAVRLMM